MEKRPLGFSLVVVTEIQLIHYLVNLKNIYILKLKDLVDWKYFKGNWNCLPHNIQGRFQKHKVLAVQKDVKKD